MIFTNLLMICFIIFANEIGPNVRATIGENGIEYKNNERIEKNHERTFVKNHHRRDPSRTVSDKQSSNGVRNFQKRHLDISANLTSDNVNKSAEDGMVTSTNSNLTQTSTSKPAQFDSGPALGSDSSRPRNCIRKYNKVAHTERIKSDNVTPKPYSKNYDYDGIEYDDYEDPPRRFWPGTLEDGTEVIIEECAHSTDSCYALWQSEDNGTIIILGQGCWEASTSVNDDNDCSSRVCAHPIVPGDQTSRGNGIAQRALPASRFCCCSGDNCNAKPEITVSVATKSSQSQSPVNKVTADSQRSAPVMAAAMLATVIAFAGLALVAVACRKKLSNPKDGNDEENGQGMDGYESHGEGSLSDPLATGLLCVDNLKIIEHIGAGRFGSVWRGSLGSKTVAVKIYPGNAGLNHWQREKDIYSLPHIKHPNILKCYGSDNRQSMSGSRECILVVELASVGTLRHYLKEGPPLELLQFVNMAHGLASALAHLHCHIDNSGQYKPCISHRDINSNNVLVRADLSICLADFGLSVLLPHRHKTEQATNADSSFKITEAGTMRYLAPEALEGALDLRSAGAALRAVDVYAMALVLWELLWRVQKVNREPTPPPHRLPYQQAGVPEPPTLEIMQSVVSRRKIRPPLPRIVQSSDSLESRIMQLASDTCSECWDHDAEARLTAVCTRERFADARSQIVTRREANEGQPDSRGVNQLKDYCVDGSSCPIPLAPSEYDKNSNCTSDNNRTACDQRTPLLYPLPHQGRNPCLERNLATVSDSDASEELIDKSLKDIVSTPNGYGTNNLRTGPEDCLSVARSSASNRVYDYISNHDSALDRYSEARLSNHRPSTPIDYVQNDMSLSSEPYYSGRAPIKQTNLIQESRLAQPKWSTGLRKLFQRKGAKKLISPLDTEVKLVKTNAALNNIVVDKTKTTIVHIAVDSNSDVLENGGTKIWNQQGGCTMSPPNQTVSQNMMMESQINPERVLGYRELPNRTDCKNDEPAQVFAVIVPKAKYTEPRSSIEMQSKPSLDIYKFEDTKDSIDSITKNSVKSSKSEHSLINTSNSESDDSAIQRKRASCDDKILQSANINITNDETKFINIDYIDDEYLNHNGYKKDTIMTAFGHNTDCSSSSEDEHIMLLSEDGGNKITMQCRAKMDAPDVIPKKKNKENASDVPVAKIASGNIGNLYNKYKTGYSNFDNELSGDNPVYVATLNGTFPFTPQKGEINEMHMYKTESNDTKSDQKLSPKPSLKHLSLSRQHSLEQVSELFTNSDSVNHLRNPADRVKTPGDVPPSVRRIRRDRALTNGMQRARIETSNRLSLYDDRMMFGNSL